MAGKNALREAQEMLKVYDGMISHSRHIIDDFDNMMRDLDAARSEIDRKKAELLRDRHLAPKRIEDYSKKRTKQVQLLHQLASGVQVVRRTKAGAPVYGDSKMAKVMRLRKQLEKLESAIESEEAMGPNDGEELRNGIRAFRHNGGWFFIFEGHTKTHGPHGSKEEAFAAARKADRK